MDGGLKKDDKCVGEQKIADIEDVVVGEKVYVNEDRKYPQMVVSREVHEGELEKLESPGNVTSYGRVQKPGEEGNRRKHEERIPGSRIGPRADGRVRFEQLHAGR